jgi:hypothetical protein
VDGEVVGRKHLMSIEIESLCNGASSGDSQEIACL